jgi:uncharacterized protein YidB (DUF937 family)
MNPMGLLDSILGRGGDQQGGGGMSPMTMALLALLAYRTYQGKGRLADMLNQEPSPESGPASSPTGGNYYGSDASATPRGGGGVGTGLEGLGGLLSGGLGGLLSGGLGQILGGAAAGSVVSSGLQDLMRRMQEGGLGNQAGSWVGTGPNQEIAPEELEQALGRDTVEDLSQQTGKPYLDVLSELSRSLPDTVDRLTPQGRMPRDEDFQA